MNRVLTAGKIITVDGRRIFQQAAVMPDGEVFSVTDSRKHWEQQYGLWFMARCLRMRAQRTIASR